MDDIQKMLRIIINGQSSFRQEVLGKIDRLEQKLTERIGGVETKLTNRINGVEKILTDRIDRLGKQLAFLEDDAPTREEFDTLKNKVDKIGHKVTL
jgi:hypothetical protein